MINNSTSSFAQLNPNSTYNRKRTKKTKKSKPPKKTNCDVNLYKYPGRKIFKSSEIVEKTLLVIGPGIISGIASFQFHLTHNFLNIALPSIFPYYSLTNS